MDSKENLVNLFFESLKMMSLRGYDTACYKDLIDENNRNERLQADGKEYNFIDWKSLTKYISLMNYSNYEVEIKTKKTPFLPCSYLLTNYQRGKIMFVCFFNTKGGDILSNEVALIINKANEISSVVNVGDEVLFSEEESILEVLVITRNKLSPYPKERIAEISGITFMNETTIIARPYNNTMQSQIAQMSKSMKAEIKIPVKDLPSIDKSDSYLTYLGQKQGKLSIHRGQVMPTEILEYTHAIRVIRK